MLHVRQCPPQPPAGNPTEHLGEVVELEIGSVNKRRTNLQQLSDALCRHGAESQRNVFKLLWNPRYEEAF